MIYHEKYFFQPILLHLSSSQFSFKEITVTIDFLYVNHLILYNKYMFETTCPKSWIDLSEAHWRLPPFHTSASFTFVNESLPWPYDQQSLLN